MDNPHSEATTSRILYFDHAATTPVRDEVREAMAPYLSDTFGNPSSGHAPGRAARAALDDARARIAEALGTDPGEIVFVRGGTEADNLAVLGRALAAEAAGEIPTVVCSSIEHRAVLDAAAEVERRGGRAIRLPVRRDGTVDPGALDDALESHPSVVSVMWVNNEVGVVQPVEKIGRRCREAGVPFHTDAIQAIGKVPVKLAGAPVDLASFTGHKISGPKGVAALYVREGVEVRPLVHGGGQERGLRAGTEDVAGAVGLAEAIALAVAEREREARRLAALRRRLEEGLQKRIPGLRVNARGAPRAPHIASVSIPGVERDLLLAALDVEGIAVSGGSACASGSTRASHVLEAMLEPREAREAAVVRFSLGPLTGEAEVEAVLRAVPRVVERLREAAPPAGGIARTDRGMTAGRG